MLWKSLKKKETALAPEVEEAPKKAGLPEGAIIKSTEEINKERAMKEDAKMGSRVSPASPPKMPPR